MLKAVKFSRVVDNCVASEKTFMDIHMGWPNKGSEKENNEKHIESP